MEKEKILELVNRYIKEELQVKKFLPGKSIIQASYPTITPEDVETLVDVALGMWYTEGGYNLKFSEELGLIMDQEYCYLVNSGSSASHIALRAARNVFESKQNMYVITTALAFPTTISPIYESGLIPYYIDVDLNLEPNYEQLIKILKEDVAGVVLTHTLGFPYDEEHVNDLLKRDRFLISDCCDAIGATIENNDYEFSVGNFSDISTLSFFPAHHITTGEGGAVLTSNYDIKEEIRKLVNWGRDCWCLPGQTGICGNRFSRKYEDLPDGYDHKYVFSRLGYNFKMTEFQAALGYSQIQRLDEYRERRIHNYTRLDTILSEHPYLTILGTYEGGINPFGVPILVDENPKFTVNELIDYLEKNKIRTRRLFAGNITRQPAFRNLPYNRCDLKNTDKLMNNAFWIGCHQNINDEQLEYMFEIFENFFKEKGL